MNLNRDIYRQFSNFAAIIVAFGTNIYANIAPPSGLTIGEISNTIFAEVLIIPASYAFAIWGIIYLGLISFAVYQLLPSQRQNPRLRRMSYLLVIASLVQIIWIFLFQYRLFIASVIAMFGILLSLIGVYLRLRIGRQNSRQEKWLVDIPISIYLAWISVATIVNVASALNYNNWNGWGISSQGWTTIMLLGGGAIAAIVAMRKTDLAFVSVYAWAFVAIAVRNFDLPIIAGCGIAIAIGLLLLISFKLLRRRPSTAKVR